MCVIRFLLVALALAWAGGSARAAPLVTGCCDSITSEVSYLDLVWDFYGWPADPDPCDHNLGVDASPSSSGLSRLEDYLLVEDPDAVIVVSGTPDTFFGPDWWPPQGYVEAETVWPTSREWSRRRWTMAPSRSWWRPRRSTSPAAATGASPAS